MSLELTEKQVQQIMTKQAHQAVNRATEKIHNAVDSFDRIDLTLIDGTMRKLKDELSRVLNGEIIYPI